MRYLIYLIAVVLILIWGTGFFGYQSGGLLYVILFVALVSLLVGIIKRSIKAV